MPSQVGFAKIDGGVHIPETLTLRGKAPEVKLSPRKATFLQGFLGAGDKIIV